MIISTDEGCNLNISPQIKLQVDFSELSECDFYEKLYDGEIVRTSQTNREDAIEYFKELLQEDDVFHISFSSGLSSQTEMLYGVAEELNENSDKKLYIYDSLNGSLGEGILVLMAKSLNEIGFNTADKLKPKLDAFRCKIKSVFTVDDLKYLVKGGRLSKISGFIGSVLNIKPILEVGLDGKLKPIKKVISRKKAIKYLTEKCVKENATDVIYVVHADAVEEADELAMLISLQTKQTVEVVNLTRLMVAHTGPGLLAVFYVGE